jgi:RimJ/RimL family protein N-acetyltransferase
LPEVIFEDRERHLLMQRSSRFTPEFVEFLEHIVWGSGGVQYTMHNVAQTLNRLKSPQFFSLMENGQLVGVTTLNQKVISLGGKFTPAFYSYGIAVDAAKRGLGYGTLLAEQRLRYGLSKVGEKGLTYGYIEATNTNSLKTNTKVGSKSIGQYHVLVTNRWRPRDDARFQRLKATRRDELVQFLSNQYENHALLDLDQSVEIDNYYILEQGDKIVTGLQCQRHHLTIRHLPGATGQMMVKILPHLPFLRRLLPERNLHYLRFGNIYAKRGMEAEVFNLMEALLARHHLNFGMIYLDKRSPVYQRLKEVDKFGLFQALIDVPVQVMAFFKGFSESEIADIHRQPLFISMMDPV